jgi:hypothetical protein
VALTPEEKRRFLKALEEDKEFKMAVTGTIGLAPTRRRRIWKDRWSR